MRTFKLIIVTLALLAIIVAITGKRVADLSKVRRRVRWTSLPYGSCDSSHTAECSAQKLLCCLWTPPVPSPCVVNETLQQCYDPKVYTCEEDVAIPGAACLCPAGYDCCYGQCYLPGNSTHGFNCALNVRSFNGKSHQLCPKQYKACNGICYNPKLNYSCCSGPGGGILTLGSC